MTTFNSNSGYTIMELLMVILIIGILSAMSIVPLTDSQNDSRFTETVEQLKQIRNAMVGNPKMMQNGARTNFGYLGDVGAIPTTAQGITALVTKPAGVSAWSLDSAKRLAFGWHGPYLEVAPGSTTYLNDAWGRAIVYTSTATPPSLTSYGADGVAGGTGYNSDIIVQIPTSDTIATITGFITQNSSPYTGLAQVDINYANGVGGWTSGTYTLNLGAAGQGKFLFNGIPFGVQSIAVYTPDKSSAANLKIGPKIISVDRANYLVAQGVTDLGSTASTSVAACGTTGTITLTNVPALQVGGTQMILTVTVSAATSIYRMNFATNNNAKINSIQFPGPATAACSGGILLSPCPGNTDGSYTDIVSQRAISAGAGQSITVTFSTNMNSSGIMKIYVYHTLGCDTLTTRVL